MNDYIAVSDGAFSFSRNVGAVGIIVIKNNDIILEYSRKIVGGTNNVAEISGIILILKMIKKPIDSLLIVSDSKIALECGFGTWKRKTNLKLWEEFDKEYNRVKQLCPKIEYKHIKGHQKDDSDFTKWNNICDKLAVCASQSI